MAQQQLATMEEQTHKSNVAIRDLKGKLKQSFV